jgi:putative SOS response-associated peptidase YedK
VDQPSIFTVFFNDKAREKTLEFDARREKTVEFKSDERRCMCMVHGFTHKREKPNGQEK